MHPLVKFGNFAKIDESFESHGTSNKMSSKPTSTERVASENVITVSDHEEEENPKPIAQVVEEHELTSV